MKNNIIYVICAKKHYIGANIVKYSTNYNFTLFKSLTFQFFVDRINRDQS